MSPGRRAAAGARAALLACALLPLAGCGGPSAVGPAGAEAEAARLARENESLRRQSELAAGDAFYMLLDAGAPRLAIMYRGVLLREFALVSAEAGEPRVGFRRTAIGEAWRDKVWSGGTISPTKDRPRVEIIPPPPGEEIDPAEFKMPPLPEEAYPTPPRFWMRYPGGLTVEYVPAGPARVLGFSARIQLRLLDALAAVAAWRAGTPRLRIVVPAEDFGTLYRAAPPDSAFLVVPTLEAPPAKGTR